MVFRCIRAGVPFSLLNAPRQAPRFSGTREQEIRTMKTQNTVRISSVTLGSRAAVQGAKRAALGSTTTATLPRIGQRRPSP